MFDKYTAHLCRVFGLNGSANHAKLRTNSIKTLQNPMKGRSPVKFAGVLRLCTRFVLRDVILKRLQRKICPGQLMNSEKEQHLMRLSGTSALSRSATILRTCAKCSDNETTTSSNNLMANHHLNEDCMTCVVRRNVPGSFYRPKCMDMKR